tara:strand:- start:22971 stop:23843 length:873 start_codon:yes stop_codon:yes gene_type:complete
MTEEAPLLNDESDHPHDVVLEHPQGRVVAMDSARYVDARNAGRDVVVPSSYLGVLPARLIAPHQPRAVIGHDGCIGKDGAGIAGLWYLEALGIPAAAADGMTAELGNGIDLFKTGIISRVNILAERAGVSEGMSVEEASLILLENDPGDVTAGTKIRRESVATSDTGREIIVTDSIVFALPEDTKNVLVTAGHTGRSGAKFLLEVSPHGFICSDGGMSKNEAGIAGLEITEKYGLAGACCDAWSAPVGDAFKAYSEGKISACNAAAKERGVTVGMTVREAALKLLAEVKA